MNFSTIFIDASSTEIECLDRAEKVSTEKLNKVRRSCKIRVGVKKNMMKIVKHTMKLQNRIDCFVTILP